MEDANQHEQLIERQLVKESKWRIWTPPRLQALRSLALRYDCSRISGLYLPHRAIDAGP